MNWMNLLKAIGIVVAVFLAPILLIALGMYLGIVNMLIITIPIVVIAGVYLIYDALNN